MLWRYFILVRATRLMSNYRRRLGQTAHSLGKVARRLRLISWGAVETMLDLLELVEVLSMALCHSLADLIDRARLLAQEWGGVGSELQELGLIILDHLDLHWWQARSRVSFVDTRVNSLVDIIFSGWTQAHATLSHKTCAETHSRITAPTQPPYPPRQFLLWLGPGGVALQWGWD